MMDLALLALTIVPPVAVTAALVGCRRCEYCGHRLLHHAFPPEYTVRCSRCQGGACRVEGSPPA
jgi:hypothetical protein